VCASLHRSLSSQNRFPVSFGLTEVLYGRKHTHIHVRRKGMGNRLPLLCGITPFFFPPFLNSKSFSVRTSAQHIHIYTHIHTHPNRIPLAVLNSFCCHRRRWWRRRLLSPKLTHRPRFCLFRSHDDVEEWWRRRSFMCDLRVCIYRSLKARPKMRKSVELKRFCIQTKANVFPRCESH
jgi:hypothetical protein